MAKPIVFFSVDPGITGTGIAIWDINACSIKNPVFIKNIYPFDNYDWKQKMIDVGNEFEKLIIKWEPVKVIIEMPNYQQTGRGHATVASGDLLKLAALVGYFANTIIRHNGEIILITVEWKGQLPKNVVKNRIIKTLPDIEKLKPTSHCWDAIGIGLYVYDQTIRSL